MELSAANAVQQRYATWLAWGTRAGLAVLGLGFAAYLVGIVPHVPIERLPALWERPAAEMLEQSGLRPGWGWAALVHRSDMIVVARR